MHWPGAGVLLVSGLTIIGLIALPLFAFIEMKKQSTQLQKFTAFSGFISGALICIASLFKIMHWPGANVLITTGLILMTTVFIPLFTLKSYKTTEFKLIAIAKSLMILAGIVVVWRLLPIMNNKSTSEKVHSDNHKHEVAAKE